MIQKSSAFIVNAQHELLVVKKKTSTSHFILPGGKLEKDEDSVQALFREIKEELGVEIQSYTFIEEVVEKSQFEDFELKMYMFDVKIRELPKPQNEILSLEWINLNTKRQDLASGITKHALPYLRRKYNV
jgi:8-oxo-dGTP diphosphatase